MIYEEFEKIGEYGAAGMYKEPNRGLFYRKASGIREFYKHCELPEYTGAPLYPSGRISTKMRVAPHFLFGMNIAYNALSAEHKELSDLFVSDFKRYKTSVPPEHGVAGNMSTHSIPNYERILKEGFLSYEYRIKKIRDEDIRDGLLLVLDGIKIYIGRMVEYLESAGADVELINALKKVPLNPAESIYEAVVAWNFILYLDNCDNLGCLTSGLAPYHNGEDITEILKNLYDNLDSNNGFSMALDVSYNELTYQCLEASKGKRRPMIELLVNEETPDKVWKKAFEVIRSGNGQPAFYNEKVIMEGLKAKFPHICDEDLKKFCGGGCTETMLAGLSNVGSIDAGINLLLILEKIMKEKLITSVSFEEFYKSYIEEVKSVVDLVTECISKSQADRAKYNPLPMRTLLVDDCIDNGTDFNNGGARYKWSIVNFAGLINVIDSMLVIRDLVFKTETYDAGEFLSRLQADDDSFLNLVRNHFVSFGRDNSDANSFASQLSAEIYSMLDQKKPLMGEAFLPASIQFMSQASAGKNIGATPDGRKSGAPLCDSLAAIFGKDVNGPTALLRSVTQLDLKRALGIPVLNFNINPDFEDNVLKGLIKGYMELGGIQVQITCISPKMLEEAYKNPQMHKNLVVRVGGYSEYFHNLSDEMMKMVIERSVQNL